MGGQATAGSGDHRRVAEGAGDVAVLGAYLLLPRHHGTDARGRQEVHPGGQELEGHHEGSRHCKVLINGLTCMQPSCLHSHIH